MRILFTSKGTEWQAAIDPRFGRTEFFFIYDEATDQVDTYDNRAIANEAHGAGPRTAQKMSEFNIDLLITGNGPGGNAAAVISQLGVKVITGAGGKKIKEAYEAYKKGELT